MRSAVPTVRLPSQINPAVAFPHQHLRCRKVGDGSEGFVEAWSHKVTGFVMAVKVIKPGKKIPLEVEVLRSLPAHCSIIHCFAYLPRLSSPNGDCIFFEYSPAGDLFELSKRMYKKNKAIFSEALVWAVFSRLSSAIAFLHEGIDCKVPTNADSWRPVVHRDIKLENVLISTLGQKDDFSSLVLKLGDFGLSAFYDPSNARMPGNWGTSVLWPPEQIWEEREATPAGDVWAVGCVMHELAHGFPPVVDPEFTEKLAKKENKAPSLPSHWSSAMRKSFWALKTPRKPLPANLDPGEHGWDIRRNRPTPKYSDALNECMMMALSLQVAQRATAATLKTQIEEEHAAFLFEELRLENEAMEKEMNGGESEGEWDE
ncbi:kinase-like protein [Lentithecium fluviatile CBS 122367]|uniref:non-specific serine/threonine protein kinase n=1 Tax=Lentithecium fluviatile CBS 122367 TaxID=1168545 RepID=A0A6G1IQL5_9PLEO|nr:kinase-like protein [Lentithecium fluviatile CBS 122367]